MEILDIFLKITKIISHLVFSLMIGAVVGFVYITIFYVMFLDPSPKLINLDLITKTIIYTLMNLIILFTAFITYKFELYIK